MKALEPIKESVRGDTRLKRRTFQDSPVDPMTLDESGGSIGIQNDSLHNYSYQDGLP